MRIAILTNGLEFGGAERVIEALAGNLRNKGVHPLIIATTRGGPIGDALSRQGHRVEVLGLKKTIDIQAIQKLRHLLSTYRPHILHSHLAVSDIASALTRYTLQSQSPTIRRITTVHNLGAELSPLKCCLWNVALKQMDRVLAVSHAVKNSLPKSLPVTVVHPSVVSQSRPPLPRQEARTRLKLSPHERVVLFVGRLVHIKGLDILSDAIQLVNTSPVTYLGIGDGPMSDYLKGTPIRLLGSRADAADVISAADVVVLPSRSEGFPQVPLQAMAAKVPVIGTRVGGTPEIVRHHETGYLVQPESPTDLAKAIDEVFTNPAVFKRYGINGYHQLQTRELTSEAMTASMIDVYRGHTANGM